MFGAEYLDRKEAQEAETALLNAVRQCKEAIPRERLRWILEWHARLAAKGSLSGDTDYLGEPYPSEVPYPNNDC